MKLGYTLCWQMAAHISVGFIDGAALFCAHERKKERNREREREREREKITDPDKQTSA